MRETGPLETDWIVISSQEATGQASLIVYFQSCFEGPLNTHTVFRLFNTTSSMMVLVSRSWPVQPQEPFLAAACSVPKMLLIWQ